MSMRGLQGLHGLAGNKKLAATLWTSGLRDIDGQSNGVGQGTTDHMDSGLNATTVFSSATIDTHIGLSITDPMVYTDVADRDMQPYDGTGVPAMGLELSSSRYEVAYNSGAITPLHYIKFAINGMPISEFLPDATFPGTPPPNVYTQKLTYYDARIAASGRRYGVKFLVHGEADAANATLAANYQSRLTTYINALRARYGNFLLVIVQLNSNATGTGNQTDRDAIRAAQVAYVATDPFSVLVDSSRIPVPSGGLHYVGDGYWAMGNAVAEALAERMHPGRIRGQVVTPAYPYVHYNNEATGRSQTSTGDITIPGPAAHETNDVDLLIVGQGTSNVLPALTTANGFALVPGATGQSIFSTAYENIAVYWRRASSNARMSDPVVTDNNTSKIGAIVTLKNCYPTGCPVESVQFSANNTNGTSVSIPGTTTLGPNRLVLVVQVTSCGGNNPAQSWSNATPTLSSFSVIRDSIDDTNQTITIAAGVKTTEGGTGTTTGTRGFASVMANLALAIKPPLQAGETVLSATIDDATDPITGGNEQVYTIQVNNDGATSATTVSAVVTLDSNLTFVSASGTGWNLDRAGQVITCTMSSMATGAANPISIHATTPFSTLTATTTLRVTASNASTVNDSETSSVQVSASQDATSGKYVPANATEWGNLTLTAPDYQWGCQDSASPLAAAIGTVTLTAGGSGQTYLDSVSGWSRKAIGTQDGATQDWVSSSASLPTLASSSVLLLLYWKPPASNPGSNRRVCLMGTSPSVSCQVSTTGKPILFAGANNQTGTTTITGSAPIPLVIKYDRTNSESKLYTLTEKVTATYSSTATGKQMLLGGAGSAAANEFLFAALWSGTNAEMSDATVKAMLQALGWSPTWT